MPVLNDICPDNAISRRLSDGVRASDESAPSRRWKRRAGHYTETWRLRFSNLNATEIESLREIYETYRKHNPLAWTPPNEECAGRAYRIADYRDACDSAGVYGAEIELTYLPGVEPPA